MIPLTPLLVIAGANLAAAPAEDGGDPSAAFVHHVGYWTHFDNRRARSSWPLPAPASCDELGEFARNGNILREEPQPADVFLLWSQEQERFAHTGIVVGVETPMAEAAGARSIAYTTIEGVARDAGRGLGWRVMRRTRRFTPGGEDRFIRWNDLDGHADESTPGSAWGGAPSDASIAVVPPPPLAGHTSAVRFAERYARYRRTIEGMALRMSGGEYDLADDLAQAARIALWQLDPFAQLVNERQYVSGVCFRRMTRYLRLMRKHESPEIFIRLDPELCAA